MLRIAALPPLQPTNLHYKFSLFPFPCSCSSAMLSCSNGFQFSQPVFFLLLKSCLKGGRKGMMMGRIVGILHLILLLLISLPLVRAQLSVDYYKQNCPQVENIIRAEMIRKQSVNPTTAAGTLRIFFHDCFVEGCDASVLIRSTPKNKAEKDADINLSLPGDGFDAVVRAKTAVEARCPGIVSCADIMSIATRDLISLVGGPYYPVKKGRKDGWISQASRVAGNLPLPTMNVDVLTALFQSKGLTQADMITLSGGHTIGFSHCKEFMHRIYRNLPQGLGLLASDQILYSDPQSRGLVQLYASNQTAFFNAFAAAMNKLGAVGVKTGSEGEIRRRCDAFN
ncbi:peroxidase 41-like isoform X2 [Cryptomeria japonica]|uniref:peroxidase 41-like isoform X2 n=1 Tax=Cryptomeria japonica TaxID=3369 RepID=UPI0027DA32C8|nr:peroxidase 41-like isoform X2 [Cryptomeria japonica]